MKSLIVGKNDAGQRLDRFLAKMFPSLGHGIIRKALRDKNIKINKKRTEADYRLALNDKLDIYLNDELLADKRSKTISLLDFEKPDIVYEDENILILNKPVGLPVHEDNERSPDTLINRILTYLQKAGEYNPSAEQSFCPALCNRIDRNTSGIVIAAKNAQALRIMSEKIKNREIKKFYLCLVSGKMPKKADIMTACLEKNITENRVYISEKKTARNLTIKTAYKVVAEYGDLSLLEVDLITGRTHQIRAHLAYIGHPIIGDPKYGSNKLNKIHGYKTQALCSYKLRFEFLGGSGILEYLNGKEYEIKDIPFLKKGTDK